MVEFKVNISLIVNLCQHQLVAKANVQQWQVYVKDAF